MPNTLLLNHAASRKQIPISSPGPPSWAGATVTPEAVVVDTAGNVLYRGRINNRFQDLGKERNVTTRHDLREALLSVMAGKPVAVPETKAIGCFIPEPKKK